jgi:mannose-6-phosphate isomerase
VSIAAPYPRAPFNIADKDEAALLGRDEAPFALRLLTLAGGAAVLGETGTQSWFVPLDGAGMIDGQPWSAGQCWLLDGAAALDASQPGKALLATL